MFAISSINQSINPSSYYELRTKVVVLFSSTLRTLVPGDLRLSWKWFSSLCSCRRGNTSALKSYSCALQVMMRDAPSRMKVALCPPPSLPGLSAPSLLVVGGLSLPPPASLSARSHLNVKTTTPEETSVGGFFTGVFHGNVQTGKIENQSHRDLPNLRMILCDAPSSKASSWHWSSRVVLWTRIVQVRIDLDG